MGDNTFSFSDMTPRHFPSQEELDAMDRDLNFVPLGVDQPQTLGRDQIDAFNRDGYIKPLTIFNAAEIDAYRAYFDQLLEQTLAQGADSYSIVSGQVRYATIYDLVRHPRIVAPVKDLLGEDCVCWGAHFFCKMPGDGKQISWHQDASYWPLTPARTVSVWLAIDRADPEKACMRFISGSHLHGHLEYRPSSAAENNVLNQTVDNAEEFGKITEVELEAGQASLHSDLLLHGSGPNRSQRRRGGLTLRYAAASVRAEYGWNSEAVVVSGSNPDDYWADPPRPDRP